MINKIQIVTIVLVIPLVALFMYSNSKGISIKEVFLPGVPTMHIGEIPVRVEIANTDAERVKGLSGRKSFSTSADGLLFVFPTTDYHSVWMKDMKFPIDLVWIGEDLKVINVEKNVNPETYPKVFKPARPARYLVETDVHFNDTFGLQAGYDVRLPLKYLED